MTVVHDVARTRLDNALLLFEEFVRATVKQADAATLRGLERRFAERLQIQPSYWSQIKARSRQIGERLARQFEQLCHKPVGWMDLPQVGGASPSGTPPPGPLAAYGAAAEAPQGLPQDDDERFIVGLVLTYYRRHPQRARTRLLGLLGEVLVPTLDTPSEPAPAQRPASPATSGRRPAPGLPSPSTSPVDDMALWQRSQAGTAPLKGKRR